MKTPIKIIFIIAAALFTLALVIPAKCVLGIALIEDGQMESAWALAMAAFVLAMVGAISWSITSR